MNQASPYARETMIESHEVCSTFTQMTGVELLPLLKHQFGKSLQDSLYAVRLMETAELLIVRSDGISYEFDASRARAETPLRRVLIQLRNVLPDDAFHELQNLAHHSCPLMHPETYQDAGHRAAEMILHFFKFSRLAEATDIFYPEFLNVLRSYEEEVIAGEKHAVAADANSNAAFLILEWAKKLAEPAAILIQERMVSSIIVSLKSASAFGVHGDEFDSAWNEYAHALNEDSVLGDIIEGQIHQICSDTFSALALEDKRILWLNVRGIEHTIKFSLDEGVEIEPGNETGDWSEVTEPLRGLIIKALAKHAEATLDCENIL
jgi:glutaredoxin 2